ncbi:hypothetical protein E2C01_043522 [Portunus trituberculatus]|uniref:Uncharacterized protein n=1 Tax=Portunus trituberculatus TaxID=210409 RepID=A0A5B7FPP6_PORTR|nr:hypothetical protein [Portunus trituberculatus]
MSHAWTYRCIIDTYRTREIEGSQLRKKNSFSSAPLLSCAYVCLYTIPVPCSTARLCRATLTNSAVNEMYLGEAGEGQHYRL